MGIFLPNVSLPDKGRAMDLRIHPNGLVSISAEVGWTHTNAIADCDMAAVVFCRNCVYCSKKDPYELWCAGFCSPARLVAPEDFCSRGKKAE